MQIPPTLSLSTRAFPGNDRTALKTGGKEILREKIFHQTDAASRSVSQSQLGAAVELLHFSSLLYGALL